MRIIDADALIADMQERLCKPCKADGRDYHEVACRACWVDDAIGEIDSAPTIDAVRVVKCKDCKHNPKYTDDYMYGRCVFCCEDDYYAGTPSDDFYCGYGERKESE